MIDKPVTPHLFSPKFDPQPIRCRWSFYSNLGEVAKPKGGGHKDVKTTTTYTDVLQRSPLDMN